MFGMGDKMFGEWETKCSAFRRTKVRRKSPAAYQEAQIKKQIEPIEIIFFHLRLPFKDFFPKKSLNFYSRTSGIILFEIYPFYSF